jgi:uncharacterized protein
MQCRKCGTCCTAPDIDALDKPVGVKCIHLDDQALCTIYDERPAVCRGYRPDEICELIEAPTLAARVGNYLKLFGCEETSG